MFLHAEFCHVLFFWSVCVFIFPDVHVLPTSGKNYRFLLPPKRIMPKVWLKKVCKIQCKDYFLPIVKCTQVSLTSQKKTLLQIPFVLSLSFIIACFYKAFWCDSHCLFFLSIKWFLSMFCNIQCTIHS